jgi:hypothetical protein
MAVLRGLSEDGLPDATPVDEHPRVAPGTGDGNRVLVVRQRERETLKNKNKKCKKGDNLPLKRMVLLHPRLILFQSTKHIFLLSQLKRTIHPRVIYIQAKDIQNR